MDLLSIGLGLGLCGAFGASIWSIKSFQDSFASMRETTAIEHSENMIKLDNIYEEMGSFRAEIENLNALIKALKATNPKLSGAINAYQLLGTIPISDYRENYSKILEIIDGLCSEIKIDSSAEASLSDVNKSLLESVFENMNQAGISISHLNPKPEIAKKVGYYALSKSDLELATASFGIAYRAMSGDDSVLMGLEKIAILEGNTESRRQWLEARIHLDPDNPDLLRAHYQKTIELLMLSYYF